MQFEQEVLQQALLEVDHLRQLEAQSRRNAESLLEGLERLSSAQSQKDSVLAILSVLSSIIEIDAAVVLCEMEDGKIVSLAETDDRLRVLDGRASASLARALRGKPVFLSNAATSDWSENLPAHRFGDYASVAMFPVKPVDYPTVIVCLKKDRAQYSKSSHERLKYFVPLAAHAIRHSFKLAELRKAVTELNKARSAAEASARTDPLTGLANRMHLEEYSAELLREGKRYSFALIDLNGFKPVNDNFGHHTGDAVLVEIGNRLRSAFGTEAMVARIGGDEFGIVAPDVDTRAEQEALGQKICALFRNPVEVEGHRFDVGGSVGIARPAQDDTSAENVLLSADSAMYSVKTRGKTDFAIAQTLSVSDRCSFANPISLSEALDDGQIIPFFQPQFDVGTGQIVGMEVLARWQHPEIGLVPPLEFIPDIERCGLSGRFTRVMLRNALTQCMDWMEMGLQVPDISVNISEANLAGPQALQSLLDELTAFPELSGKILFELTERIFINRSAAQVAEALEHLEEAGVRHSLDDFGTGFANLSNLSRIRFHELKIDRQFIDGIGNDPRKEAVVEAVVSIARAHGARSVAEGVENRIQYGFLRLVGCDLAQGYLLHKPADSDTITELLSDPSKLRSAG